MPSSSASSTPPGANRRSPCRLKLPMAEVPPGAMTPWLSKVPRPRSTLPLPLMRPLAPLVMPPAFLASVAPAPMSIRPLLVKDADLMSTVPPSSVMRVPASLVSASMVEVTGVKVLANVAAGPRRLTLPPVMLPVSSRYVPVMSSRPTKARLPDCTAAPVMRVFTAKLFCAAWTVLRSVTPAKVKNNIEPAEELAMTASCNVATPLTVASVARFKVLASTVKSPKVAAGPWISAVAPCSLNIDPDALVMPPLHTVGCALVCSITPWLLTTKSMLREALAAGCVPSPRLSLPGAAPAWLAGRMLSGPPPNNWVSVSSSRVPPTSSRPAPCIWKRLPWRSVSVDPGATLMLPRPATSPPRPRLPSCTCSCAPGST